MFVFQFIEIIKKTIPRFTYTPFIQEGIIKSMINIRERGNCMVQHPNFYKTQNMLEFGIEK